MMLLVNNSLNFQMAILQIHCYFLLKKCENPLHCIAKDSHIFSSKNNSEKCENPYIFSTKNNSVFAFKVDK